MSRSQILHELSETLDRAKEKLDALEPESKEIYVFGAGNTARLYRNGFATENIHPKAYLDNDPNKQGNKFDGVSIVSPTAVADKDRALVLICSPQPNVNAAVSKQLDELGLKHINVEDYFFARHRTEVMQCAELFDDDESASTFAKMIALRMNPGFVSSPPFVKDQYFALPPFMSFNEHDVFVDCGAYVGDTLERYLFDHAGIFDKIFCFEPDAKNFKALTARRRRLNEEWALDDGKINLINAGVGRESATLFVHETQYGGSQTTLSEEGEYAVKVIALDEYFADQRITFLKADIESYELDMLKGAERIIRRDRPKLAICIYHNASDMFRVPLRLDSLGLGYKFAVRQHSYGIGETVLYAWQ